jgi:hypothetical protein
MAYLHIIEIYEGFSLSGERDMQPTVFKFMRSILLSKNVPKLGTVHEAHRRSSWIISPTPVIADSDDTCNPKFSSELGKQWTLLRVSFDLVPLFVI